MPMEIFVADGETRVRQSFDAPTVYFDHWAICEFSDDVPLQDRFVRTMLEKRGTFVLSHTNLVEFTAATDPRHAQAAERFLDRLMPNVYLTDFSLEKAEAFEAQFVGERMWPSADLPMLKFLTERSIVKGHNLTLVDFISLSHLYRDRIAPTFTESTQSVLRALNTQRLTPAYVEQARRSVPDVNRPKTRVVMGELMRELTIDARATITVNDIVDWQHAIVPVSCCDYVLLDGKWEQRVRAMVLRTAQAGVDLVFAKCFSKRNAGLTRFLDELERHECS